MTTANPTPFPFIILSKEAAAKALTISVTTFESEVRAKRYPPAREISPGRIGWLYEELLDVARKLPVSSGLPPRNSGYGRACKAKDASSSKR